MTNFIPLFPLNIVVFPGEVLNLHIFEPRYIQLINECIAEKKLFGIPAVLNDKLLELGTSMEIIEIVKRYDSGEMDIKTRGVDVFRVLELIQDIPEKLYWGAIVNYPENSMLKGNNDLARKIREEVKRLYDLLNVSEKFPEETNAAISYQIAHFVGFTMQQEYELLGLFQELQRLEYIRRHLNNITPVIKELEQLKARVQMNGHFRDLSSGDFNL